MANHKSAKKRYRQDLKKNAINVSVKTSIKTAIKNTKISLKKDEETSAKLQKAQSIIDKAVKKGILHKKSAARKKSRLFRFVNSLSS